VNTKITDIIEDALYSFNNELRVAMPGTVIKFYPETQMVDVKPSITMEVDGENVVMSQLIQVPVVMPSSGGVSITFPIQAGDEVLVVFSDRTIDGWNEKGGVGTQTEHRSHHISDGIAIVGLKSKPRTYKNMAGTMGYDTKAFQIRDDAGTTSITLTPGGAIDITSTAEVNIIDCDVIVTGGDVKADGISLKDHTHDGDSGGVTGPPK